MSQKANIFRRCQEISWIRQEGSVQDRCGGIGDFGTEEVSEVEIIGEIEALNVVCWNCHKEGYLYKNCPVEKQRSPA